MKRLTALILALLMVFSTIPMVSGLFVNAEEAVVETVYVNGAYTGTDSDGSQEKPFLNFNTAYNYLANMSTAPDEAVILVSGDTPLVETIKSRAQNKLYQSTVAIVAGSGGNHLKVQFKSEELSFPVTIRGAGGKLTQSYESVKDIADPSTSNPDKLVGLELIFYVKSDLSFDNIEIDAYADNISFTCSKSVSLTFEDDVKINGVNKENFTITLQKLGNTVNLMGGSFSSVTMDTTTTAVSGSESNVKIGAGVIVYDFYGCGKTEKATYDVSGVVMNMYMAGYRTGATGTRVLNLRGDASISNLYLGSSSSTAASSADFILNLYGGEINMFYATGAEGAECSGSKTVNAYEGYEYAIDESALPGMTVRNEYRTNPPAGPAPSYTVYVGEGGNDANNGKTPATKLESLDAAISKAIGVYNRGLALSVVINVVGKVEMSVATRYVTPKFDFPLTIKGGSIVNNWSGNNFNLIFQGPIILKDIDMSFPNITWVYIYGQQVNASYTPISPEAAYPITLDGCVFSTAGYSVLVGRSSADIKLLNGSKVERLLGGKTIYVEDSTVTGYIAGLYSGDIAGSDTYITMRNSTTPVVFPGGYSIETNKAVLRLEKGSSVTSYIRASYGGGGAAAKCYVEEMTVIFAGGTAVKPQGKGDNYYRFNQAETGETGVSKIIVDGNIGLKYAPAESACVDFDSYEVINFNPNVKETVYVDPTYTGLESDGSKAKPFTNLSDAFQNFIDSADDGTIILLKDTELPNGSGIPAFEGVVTITSNKKAKLFLGSDAENIQEFESSIIFKNITLAVNASAPAEATIYANGNDIVFGSGVTVADFDLNVYGGSRDGRTVKSSKITLNSGDYKKVVGGNASGDVSGDIEIIVEGANVDLLIGGNENDTVFGGVYIWVEKGVVNTLYAANYTSGTVQSTGVLVRNKNAKITTLLTTMLSDGETSGVTEGGDTILKKLGSAKLPAEEFVVGFADRDTSTSTSIYVNGKTKVPYAQADGSKTKPYNNLIDAFIAADAAEANAGKFLESIEIIVTGATELNENLLSKLSESARKYLKVSLSTNATTGLKINNTTVSTPVMSTPVTIRGTGSGKLIAAAATKYTLADNSTYTFDNDYRTFAPSASITYKNITLEISNARQHLYPTAGYSTYFTSTFNRVGGVALYVINPGGKGVKMMVFGGTFNYIWTNRYGDGEVIVGGDATRITGYLAGYNGGLNNKIEILGGVVSQLYGGPSSGGMNGDVTITVVGGNVGTMYAGGMAGDLAGNVRVNLGGGTVSGVLDGDFKSGAKHVSGKRTLRYTVEFAVKARTATNFDSMKMVDRIVATGDDGSILIWSGAFLMALAGFASLMLLRRKKRYSAN